MLVKSPRNASAPHTRSRGWARQRRIYEGKLGQYVNGNSLPSAEHAAQWRRRGPPRKKYVRLRTSICAKRYVFAPIIRYLAVPSHRFFLNACTISDIDLRGGRRPPRPESPLSVWTTKVWGAGSTSLAGATCAMALEAPERGREGLKCSTARDSGALVGLRWRTRPSGLRLAEPDDGAGHSGPLLSDRHAIARECSRGSPVARAGA